MNEVCPPGPWLDREMKGRLTGMHLYEQWMSIKDQLFEMKYNILLYCMYMAICGKVTQMILSILSLKMSILRDTKNHEQTNIYAYHMYV